MLIDSPAFRHLVVPSFRGVNHPRTTIRTGQAPGRGLSGRRRRQRSPTSISRHSDLCHAPHVQHLRQPMLCSCRSMAMELAANQSKTVSQSGTIQAFIKDTPV